MRHHHHDIHHGHDDHDDLRDHGPGHGRRHRDPGGHGRRRARRGAVGGAVLALLDEQPMHGYELIGALSERTGGRWSPSPGSIYPALRRLEQRGFIVATEATGSDDGKRRFELTDAGRERVQAQRDGGNDEPWADHGLGQHGELRRAMAELSGPARQIGRFGSPEQTRAAVATVKEATAKLYRLLADGHPDEATTGQATPGETTTDHATNGEATTDDPADS